MQTQIGRRAIAWRCASRSRWPTPCCRPEGASVEIEAMADGRIVLRPKPPVTPSLAELLAAISPDNLPEESFDDAAKGSERL